MSSRKNLNEDVLERDFVYKMNYLMLFGDFRSAITFSKFKRQKLKNISFFQINLYQKNDGFQIQFLKNSL